MKMKNGTKKQMDIQPLGMTIEVLELGTPNEGNQTEKYTVVLKLLPKVNTRGEELQCYHLDSGDVSIKVSYVGSFNQQGEQRAAFSYVPSGVKLEEGPILQDTTGYIRVSKGTLPLILEVFKKGDYLAVKDWHSDIYLSVDTKGKPMLIMNTSGKPITLAKVPGNNLIPPFPRPDARTIIYKQHTQGVKPKQEIPF